VDWDLILLMEPPTLLGAIAGSYINKLLPVWISHILLAVLLTLMTARVAQRACRIYHRETAAQANAGQPSSNEPPAAAATAAVQASQAAAQLAGISRETISGNGSLAHMTKAPCRPICSTSGSEFSNHAQGRIAGNAVLQLSAVSASDAAVATGSSTMISTATMSRRRSRPLLSASQQQQVSAVAAGDPHQAEDPPAHGPSPAAQAMRVPSSTLIPLEIEGNISEEVLVQLVSGPDFTAALADTPPAAAVGNGPGCGEILLQGTGALPGLQSSSTSSGDGTHQQQQQHALEADEAPPPCPAECKLLYAPLATLAGKQGRQLLHPEVGSAAKPSAARHLYGCCA